MSASDARPKLDRRRLLVTGAVLPAALLGARAPARASVDLPRRPVSQAGAPFATIAPEVVRRLVALDPDAVSAEDVREVLAHAPAPRVIALHGSVPIITMQPFAEFLIAMGYPQSQLRNPLDGSLTYSSYGDGRTLAGSLAWHYEREGLVPLLVGHSQGGLATLRALHVLAGGTGRDVSVWNPEENRAEDRVTLRDPYDGRERPVTDLRVPYAAAIATGRLMRLLLGQWDSLAGLYELPNSVDEFTGFFIDGDPFTPGAGRPDSSARFRARGRTRVRNVVLPSEYGHITAPLTQHLAANEATRSWIERFDPQHPPPPPRWSGVDTRNLIHAAYLWSSIKRHWCLGAQRLARAGAAVLEPADPSGRAHG